MSSKLVILLTTLIFLLSISCVKFDDGGSSKSNNSNASGDAEGTALDKNFEVDSDTFLKQKAAAKIRELPSHFTPSLKAKFEFDNANNSDLNDIHLVITDVSGNTYYSGSARGLLWQTKSRPLDLGGNEEILVEATHGTSISQLRYKVKDGKLKIILF